MEEKKKSTDFPILIFPTDKMFNTHIVGDKIVLMQEITQVWPLTYLRQQRFCYSDIAQLSRANRKDVHQLTLLAGGRCCNIKNMGLGMSLNKGAV